MNKKTRVKVKTSVGTTVGISSSKEVDEVVSQGSTEAGLISSVNLASGVVDFFSSSEDEISYGPLLLRPQSYQDDLLRMCVDSSSSQAGLDRFESLAETENLSYNLDKSSIVILGAKKAREKLTSEFEENPSKLYGKNLKLNEQESYLDEVIGVNTSDSITFTINKRIGLA